MNRSSSRPFVSVAVSPHVWAGTRQDPARATLLHRHIRQGVALLLIFVVASAALAPPAARAASDIPPPYSSLAAAVKDGFIQQETIDRANKKGAAPVVLQLRLAAPFTPEGGNDLASSQELAIKSAQDKVLNNLTGAKGIKPANVKRFQTIPHLALSADPTMLTKLVSMTDVVSRILVDHVNATTLANSVPLISADVVRRAENSSAGAGQTIAILDTGVDATHPFLNPRVVSEACFSSGSPWYAIDKDAHGLCPGGNDSSSASGSGAPCNVAGCDHGTHVAGIAAGRGASFNGVAPEANILSIQVFHSHDDTGDCQSVGGGPAPCVMAFDSDVIQGLERAFGLRTSFTIAAVNLSLGGGGAFTSRANCDSNNSDYKNAIDNLRSVGIATVAAAGNGAQVPVTTGGTMFINGVTQPACVSSAVSVGATTGVIGGPEQVAGFSQTASFLDLLAPGVSINSSVPGTGFSSKSGTSMATPHVAGAFAVLKALSPSASVATILNRLSTTGTSIVDGRPAPSLTKPRIKLDAAAEALLGKPLPPTSLFADVITGTTVHLRWTDNSPSETSFVVSYKRPADANFTTMSVSADVTQIPVGSLVPNTTYQLLVQACNPTCSDTSNQIQLMTLDTLPGTPTNLRPGNVNSTSIELLWDYNSLHSVTYYQVNSTIIDSSNPAFTSHRLSFSGLNPNSDYYYQARACNSDGCSPWSGTVRISSAPVVPLPVAPSNLHVCGLPAVWPPVELCMAGGVPLVWNLNSSDETSVEVQWTPALVGMQPGQILNWNSVSLPARSTSYRLLQATPGVLHYFQVRACNTGGCSGWSNVLSYTP